MKWSALFRPRVWAEISAMLLLLPILFLLIGSCELLITIRDALGRLIRRSPQ